MKIALITSMKYGLTQFIFRDIDALFQKGHTVQLFTLYNEPGLYMPRPGWEVIPAERLQSVLRTLFFALQRPLLFCTLLWTALRTGSLTDLIVAIGFVEQMQDAQVIYAYFGDHKLFTGYYCKRILGIPLLVTIRAYELHRNPNPKMMRIALAYCDRVVTITDYNKQLLVNKFGVPAEQIEIVRQIVDLEQFQQRSKIKILIVGFFAEKKGHEVLFRALQKLDRPDVELWVVGDLVRTVVGVDCRQLVAELGLTAKVAFFGVQSGTALRALYNECDIFCLPSRPDRYGDLEGFPNVIAEAMAFGKPVVSTQHAGIPEAIDSLLVPENDVEALAAALVKVCDDVALRQQLGAQNRQRAEQLFSPANNERLAAILSRYARPTPLDEPPVQSRAVQNALGQEDYLSPSTQPERR